MALGGAAFAKAQKLTATFPTSCARSFNATTAPPAAPPKDTHSDELEVAAANSPWDGYEQQLALSNASAFPHFKRRLCSSS